MHWLNKIAVISQYNDSSYCQPNAKLLRKLGKYDRFDLVV